MPIAFVAAFVIAASAYPLVTLVSPDVVIRLQVRATARDTDWRRGVGQAVQRWLRIDPDGNPWDDPSTRRRVRYLGLAQLVVIWAIAAAVLLIT